MYSAILGMANYKAKVDRVSVCLEFLRQENFGNIADAYVCMSLFTSFKLMNRHVLTIKSFHAILL